MSQRNRRLDVVFIRFERRQGRRRITAVRVIGSARPCQRFLVVGERVGPASRCLLRNGFRLVRVRGNVLVFVRVRRRDRGSC